MINEHFTKKKETAFRSEEDYTLVINLENSTFHKLNPVASFIWEQLDGKTSLEYIIRQISEEYDVDYEIGKKDCLDLIDELLAKDLIIKYGKNLEGN